MPDKKVKIFVSVDGRLVSEREVATEESEFLNEFLNKTSSLSKTSPVGQALQDTVVILNALGVEKEKIVDLIINQVRNYSFFR